MGQGMEGPLKRFFASDHCRLERLLEAALAHPGRIEPVAFEAFRAGLLRHIGMEEKVLFPLARRSGGAARSLVERLRVDHGAIAALLVPTPTAEIVVEIRSVLGPHNRREEDPGGAYDVCDAAAQPGEAQRLVQELGAFPEVPLKPYNDGPHVMRHIDVNLALARSQWLDDDGS